MRHNERTLADVGIRPRGFDKLGPKYHRDDLNAACGRMILTGDYFYRVFKMMTEDARKAIEMADGVRAELAQSLELFNGTQKRFAEVSKTASGQVRDAADKLAAGLAKVEKAADFNRLERYVELLERAAGAMQTLSELDRDGRLERIAAAIR